MHNYVATFHSHFGAMTYCKTLQKQGVSARLTPVPRAISSSCGACVIYAHKSPIELDDCELEAIYMEKNGILDCVLTIE